MQKVKNKFVFDLNKCVGCNACVLACNIENSAILHMHWRKITPYNAGNIVLLPLFQLSHACYHCAKAPCLQNCPALAYTRHPETGAVIHDKKKCIGCKYCTWVCPYDAPKFNANSGVIEKCTFCNNRILNNMKPACANLCPTGALDFKQNTVTENADEILGFKNFEMQPSVTFIPLRKHNSPEIAGVQAYNNFSDVLPKSGGKLHSKISAKSEASLVIFTLLVALLAAMHLATGFSGFKIAYPYLYIFAGLAGMALSMLHLGKPLRAWRAALNIRNSWLSREIVFFTAFFACSVLLMFYRGEYSYYLQLLTAIFTFGTLISVDMVYIKIIKVNMRYLHSASVFITTILLASLFSEHYLIAIGAGLLKTVLFVMRKWSDIKQLKVNFTDALRLDFLLSFPLVLYFIDFKYPLAIIISVIIGEILDRIDFYNEIEVVTPEKQIETAWN